MIVEHGRLHPAYDARVTSSEDVIGSVGSAPTATLTGAAPDLWTSTLTVTAVGTAVPQVAAGTYYVTVEGTGDGYTDETIIAVTVTVPSVAVTSPGNMTAMQTSTSTMVSSTTVSSFADVVGRHGSTCRFCGTCSIDCLRLPGRKLLIRGLAELSMPGIFDTVGSQDHKDSQCQPIANYFSLLSKRCLILITTPNAT